MILIPVFTDEYDTKIFIGLANEQAITAAASLWSKLIKICREIDEASKRLEKINDKMPYDVQKKIRERYITAMESFLNTKDSLQKIELQKDEWDKIFSLTSSYESHILDVS